MAGVVGAVAEGPGAVVKSAGAIVEEASGLAGTPTGMVDGFGGGEAAVGERVEIRGVAGIGSPDGPWVPARAVD
jgi:hypothetical protein